MSMSESDKQQKAVTGVVISAKRQKTITVRVDWARRHPKYGKVLRCHTKYHVHDAAGIAAVGDFVQIQECRPISKTKSWVLVQVLKKSAEQAV